MVQSYRRELTIVLTGDAKGLTGTVRVTRGDLDALGRTLDKTSGTAERSGKRIGKALDKSEASASRLNSTASRLGKTLVGALSVAALLQTARGLGRMADEYSNIGAQMRQASDNAVNFAHAQATAYGVAQRTTASLAATAQLISNVNRALRSMGETGVAAFQHSAQLAETINQAIALSHVSAASADAALIQLNQGLASGTLRGDELNSVMEQTPRLAAAIAAGMGVTIGQLRAMGAEGKITSQIVVEALKSQAAVLSKEYADLPLTIGRAWTQLTNAVERYVGQADQAKGASRSVAESISAVAKHVNEIARAVVTLGEVVAVVYAKKLIVWGLAWIASLRVQTAAIETETVAMTGLGVRAAETTAITKSALVAQSGWAATTKANIVAATKSIGKMGVAFNILGAALVGWQIGKYLRDQFLNVRLAAIAFVDGTLSGWEDIKYGAQVAWAAIEYRFAQAIEYMRRKLAGFFDDMASKAGELPDWLGGSKLADVYKSFADAVRPATDATAEFDAKMDKLTSAHHAALEQIHATTNSMADYQIAQSQAKNATSHATTTTKHHTTAIKANAKAVKAVAADYAKLAQMRSAATGRDTDPISKAWADSAARIREIAQTAGKLYTDLRAAGVSEAKAEALARDEVAKSLDAETAARNRALAAAHKEMDIATPMIQKLQQEAQLTAMNERNRSIARAGMEAEQKLREKNLGLTEQQIEAQKQRVQVAAAAAYDMEQYARRQSQIAQEFAGFWSNAASSISQAFGDLFTHQTDGFKDFDRSLVSIAKQMVSDIIAQFARLKIIGPMLSGAMNTVGGWLGYAGQFLQSSSLSQNASYYGGGSIISPSPAMGGASGGADYGSYLKNGLTAYKAFNWAANGGLWGGAAAGGASALGAGAGLYGGLYGGSAALGAASAAGSFTGAGALAGGTYVGGTGLYASTAGTGVAGAASSVSWIPIVGWIVAAILANVSLYEQGWSASAKVNKDLYSGNALSTGLFLSGLSGPAMIDKGLHALGANDFISSLLSGSSGFTALFGHRAPRLQRGGIDVDFSAAGITGQSYADWKAKGGLFRSDKYGTATGALDADTLKSLTTMWDNIQKSMEQAAQSIGGSVGKSFSVGLKTVTEKGEDEPSKYIVSYLGKTWEEATSEAAQQRIGADAILSVLQQSLGSVVTKMSADWQTDAATLADGAQAMLAIQTDIVHGQSLVALGSQASFAQVLTFVESLQAEGEKLTQTYQRLQAASQAYVQFVGQFEPTAVGFGGVLEGIAKQMQANIDQANALAKAAGMQGAAEKDLTNIHRVAAEQAADAIAKLNVAAQDLATKLYDVTNNSLAAVSAQLDKLQGKTQSALQLAIGDKSPLSVTEKLALALKGLRSGLTSADDVLSLGQQLYRGADYAGLYNKVQQIIGGPGAGGVGSLNDAISKYTDLYTQQQQLQQQAAAAQRFADSKTLAQYVADLSATHGIGYADVAKNLGFSLGSLAKDLGVTNLAGYLDKLKLQDVAGTGMTDSGSIVTAIHDLGRDLLQSITGAPLAPDNAVLTKISTGTDEQTQLLASIDKRLAAIENSNEATAKNTGDQAKTTRSLALRQTAAGTRTRTTA